jgi:CheY-like chemotaxis protein
MNDSRSGGFVGADNESRRPINTETTPIDPALVMVVGNSRINSVVVSKIVERCGLRCMSTSPEDFRKAIRTSVPALIILDGGADNSDCESLLSWLGELRGSQSRPAVILLTTRNIGNVDDRHAAVIDAVVPKPILPETLQPSIRRYAGIA